MVRTHTAQAQESRTHLAQRVGTHDARFHSDVAATRRVKTAIAVAQVPTHAHTQTHSSQSGKISSPCVATASSIATNSQWRDPCDQAGWHVSQRAPAGLGNRAAYVLLDVRLIPAAANDFV